MSDQSDNSEDAMPMEVAIGAEGDGIVTAHILRKAKPGQLPALEEKISATLELAAKAEGYIGSGVFRGTLAGIPYVSVILHFASRSQLEHWRQTAQAKHAFVEASRYALEPPEIEFIEGKTGWFDYPEVPTFRPAPKWKMAIVTWLAIYPILTLFIMGTGPFLGDIHVVARLFVSTLMIAPLMTWIVMPTMTRIFRRWLFAR